MRKTTFTVLAVWSVLAIVLAASGSLRDLPPLAIPPLIWAPVIAFAVWYLRSAALRDFVRGLDPRPAVWLHACARTFFGLGFLVAYEQGRLPGAFALHAGWGDLLVGVTAVLVALAPRPRLLRAWNVLGLADILSVFASAQYHLLVLGDPQMRTLLAGLPFALLPVLVVPLVLITHAAIFVATSCSKRSSRASSSR